MGRWCSQAASGGVAEPRSGSRIAVRGRVAAGRTYDAFATRPQSARVKSSVDAVPPRSRVRTSPAR